MNVNQVPVNNHGDQPKSVGSKGLSSNISTINHVLINLKPNLQGSSRTDSSSENKIQIPAIPRIAPGFSMVIPKSEKKTVVADLAQKPAYVSVSVPKNNAKAVQHGPDAVNFSSPFNHRC
jgi:hypothetical protein